MARKIRIEYAGAAYHVTARGNQGRDIYQSYDLQASQDLQQWETLGTDSIIDVDLT
jgi:hypothetical protein